MRPVKDAHNLSTALLARVVLPVFLLLALMLLIALEVIAQFAEARMQRDLRQVARAIELPVAQALERNDEEQLSSSLESVFEISEVYGAYVFDVEGNRLVSFGSVQPSRSQADRAVEFIVDVESEFDQYEQISGRDVYSFFLPVFDSAGRPNGLLQVTRRRSDIEHELGLLNRWAWGGFVVVLCLMLASLMLTHHRVIGRPIAGLLRSMHKVSAGDRHHRAAPSGPREIRQLAGGLNTMLDAIHTAESQARAEFESRQLMEKKLRHAETMAVLGQLSAGVAHELGAPLTVVDGRAARLLRQSCSDSVREELNAIRQQVGRMSSLVEQLLNFGRNSRAPLVSRKLSELYQHFASLASEHGWRVSFKYDRDAVLLGDLMSLGQAFGNLLRNAVQACPEGEVRAGWELLENNRVAMYVEDAGPGIADDIRERIFEPFVTSKLPGQGSGMGLAIVQRVAQEHDGIVRVSESKLGGACFVIELPLQADAR